MTDLAGEIFDGGYLTDEDERGPATRANWVDRDPTRALEKASEFALRLIDETGTDTRRLVGIGISMPAPLMDDDRPYAGFMDAWQSRHVADELRRQLRLPDTLAVESDNDANLTALWECGPGGAARGATHACVIQWGPGLGAGLILKGQLYRGPQGLARDRPRQVDRPARG